MKTQNNKDQLASVKKEIEQALTSSSIQFEEIPEDNASPLNQPVVEKNSTAPHAFNQPSQQEGVNESGEDAEDADDSQFQSQEETLDAPEQEISQAPSVESSSEEDFEIPLSHAQIAADTFLGITDNLLEVGGGFFIKIRKHEDFYEFDEVVQVIDEQNQKNIKRFKLDDEDKALLRPLLILVIRKRAKKLTPEQQLAGAAISILVKKAKLAMEMRAENNLLVERIRDIIKQETGNTPEDTPSKPESTSSAPTLVQNPELASVLEVAE